MATQLMWMYLTNQPFCMSLECVIWSLMRQREGRKRMLRIPGLFEY
jgi:hypothetical protein